MSPYRSKIFYLVFSTCCKGLQKSTAMKDTVQVFRISISSSSGGKSIVRWLVSLTSQLLVCIRGVIPGYPEVFCANGRVFYNNDTLFSSHQAQSPYSCLVDKRRWMNQGIIHVRIGRTSTLLLLFPRLSFHCHFRLHHIPCLHWNAAGSFQNPHRQKGRGRKREGRKEEGIKCQRDRERERI